MVPPPWVGLPTDSTMLGHHRFAAAGEKYIHALVEAAGVTPVLLPSLPPPLPAAPWLDRLQGLLLTGAVSNIEPHGLIEAARSTAHRFVLGVQWHPEWRVADNPFYHSIFHAFGDACRRNSLTADRS
ncbi:gamma-glutamyl-gamma-aminobutyrate hydrolase family protein [Stenotrophomonas sp. Ker107b]